MTHRLRPMPAEPRRPTLAQIRAEARRIHTCPDGYKGPCWGPHTADFERAKRNLTEPAGTPKEPQR